MSFLHGTMLVLIQCVAFAAGLVIGRARIHWGLRIGAAMLVAPLVAAILMVLGFRWTLESMLVHIAGASAVYAEGQPPTVPGSALIGMALVAIGASCGRSIPKR
jgi:hypothetical protein